MIKTFLLNMVRNQADQNNLYIVSGIFTEELSILL